MDWSAQIPPRRRWQGPMRQLLLAAAAIAILVAGWLAFWNAAPLPISGKPVIAYQLRPRAQGGFGTDGPGYFHLYKVEQTIASVPANMRSKLIDILSSNSSYVSTEGNKFDPVMGFSFGIGSDRTDVMYSVANRKVWFLRGNESARRSLSDNAVRQLNAIYQQLFHEDPITAAHAPAGNMP